jgi:hypothetical protein
MGIRREIFRKRELGRGLRAWGGKGEVPAGGDHPGEGDGEWPSTHGVNTPGGPY